MVLTGSPQQDTCDAEAVQVGGRIGYAATSWTAESGLATATGTNAGRLIQSPLILPALFTASQTKSVRPADRIFFDYSHSSDFRILTVPATGPFITEGFNLNQFDVGVEKTFLDGFASFTFRVPFQDTTDNTTGLHLSGLGDLNAGLKFVLLADQQTGSLLSAGLTVSAPTACRQPTPFGNGSSFNPTILQPWIGGNYVAGRLVVREFLGVVIPTDDRVATFINNNVGIGYRVYKGIPGELVSSITPTFDVQVAYSHRSRRHAVDHKLLRLPGPGIPDARPHHRLERPCRAVRRPHGARGWPKGLWYRDNGWIQFLLLETIRKRGLAPSLRGACPRFRFSVPRSTLRGQLTRHGFRSARSSGSFECGGTTCLCLEGTQVSSRSWDHAPTYRCVVTKSFRVRFGGHCCTGPGASTRRLWPPAHQALFLPDWRAPGVPGIYFTDRASLRGCDSPADFAWRLSMPAQAQQECQIFGCAVIRFDLPQPHAFLPLPPLPGAAAGFTAGGAREWLLAGNLDLAANMEVHYIDQTTQGPRHYLLPL